MTQPYLSLKSQVLKLLNDQLDQVRDKKTLKLNNLNSKDTSISEVIECIHEFIHNYQPPLEIERLSLHNNQIHHLPSNFPIISSNIRYLDLHNNNISIFPSALSECGLLEILDISSNRLSNISRSEISKLQNLRVISLKENRFKYLPPVLGELPNMNLIEVADNPLIFPSHEVIKGFQNQSAELDWVGQLKQYLRANKTILELKISELDSSLQLNKQKLAATSDIPIQYPANNQNSNSSVNVSAFPNPPSVPPPSILRSKSISETKTKASKAARRMGLIIKKTEENSNSNNNNNDSQYSHARSQSQSIELISHSHDLPTHPPPSLTSTITSSTPTSLTSSFNTSESGLNQSPKTNTSNANITTVSGSSANTSIFTSDDTNKGKNDLLNENIFTNSILNNDFIMGQVPHSASATETSFKISSPPLSNMTTNTASTVPNSLSNSPSLTPVHTSNGTVVNTNVNASLSSINSNSTSTTTATTTLSRPSSRNNRSRSNTLKEIDSILEKNDNVDAEHKSGAYFRRLSTLQESPNDENSNGQFIGVPPIPGSNPNSNPSSRQGSLSRQAKDNIESLESARSGGIKSPPGTGPRFLGQSEGSPSKLQPSKRSIGHSPSTIIKLSRKVLFSFSELHSSVRRFTGFCNDKKITIRMVSLLYTTKSNIDNLVENLEIMEESGDNLDQITNSLHASIGSFKSIMTLLSENFSNFVAKIDVCFIRMLYLTIYGSFNELLNAYRILVPTSKPNNIPTTNNPSITLPGTDPKATKGLSVNTTLANNEPSNSNGQDIEGIDEKLYQTIELATNKAQVVFNEITKALNKSAIASTNGQQPISPTVASKVKELTTICISSMDITKRVRTKLITIRNNPSQTTKKLFWSDVNLFLKAIVNTLGPVKVMIKDLPILNEARASILNLTKTTKDVPILLEVSSYSSLLSSDTSATNQLAAPTSHNQPPNINNMFTPLSAHPSHLLSLANLSLMNNTLQSGPSSQPPVRTPLAATLGPAAQAIVSNNDVSKTNTNGQNFTITSPPILSPGTLNVGSLLTAPAQSSGQYFAKNGMNPFDGLIAAKDKEAV